MMGGITVATAPLRVSLAGGGTDAPGYYGKHGGLVVGFTMSARITVIRRQTGTSGVGRTVWMDDRLTPAAGANVLAAQVLREGAMAQDDDFVSFSPVTMQGSGLGASAAFALALLRSVHGHKPSPSVLAETAWETEARGLGRYAGKQDPYLSAHGGMRAVRIEVNGSTRAEALQVGPKVRDYLQNDLLLFDTRTRRDAAYMTTRAAAAAPDLNVLRRIHAVARNTVDAIGEDDPDAVEDGVREHGELKSRSTAQTPRPVQAMIRAATLHGARAVRLMGAGGGGFLLVSVRGGERDAVRTALTSMCARELLFDLDERGARSVDVEH
jgi:D-glycero-alpha-D-manno-heptose-7-phosphate kinase